MTTVYVENPHNFHEISNFVIVDVEQICNKVIQAENCFFYDTCSFRKHANLNDNEKIIRYVSLNGGLVIITRTILMELASQSGNLQEIYINYFEKMYSNGLIVAILNEEDIFHILAQCYSSNAKINAFLEYAIKTVKLKTGTVESTLEDDSSLKRKLMNGKSCSERSLFSSFFQTVRNNKESGDNLGEELLAVCLHLLANMPEAEEYKYKIFSDDRGAVALIGKVKKNCYTHSSKYAMTLLSTPKLVQLLYENGILGTKTEIEGLLNISEDSGNITVFGSEKFDLNAVEKRMTRSELAEKILVKEIHINY